MGKYLDDFIVGLIAYFRIGLVIAQADKIWCAEYFMIFLGIPFGRNWIIGILAGVISNGLWMFKAGDLLEFVVLASEAFLGAMIGEKVSSVNFWFMTGGLSGLLIVSEKQLLEDLVRVEWVDYLFFTLSLSRLLLLYTERSVLKNKEKTLYDYYLDYPADKISNFMLFCLYLTFYFICAGILHALTCIYPPDFTLVFASVTCSVFFSLLFFIFLSNFIKKYIKPILLSLLLLMVVSYFVQHFNTQIFLVFITLEFHLLWHTLSVFHLYTLGKAEPTLLIILSPITACLYFSLLYFFPFFSLSFLPLFLLVPTTFLFLYTYSLPSHPAYLFLKHNNTHTVLYQNYPYTLRKEVHQSLTQKLI